MSKKISKYNNAIISKTPLNQLTKTIITEFQKKNKEHQFICHLKWKKSDFKIRIGETLTQHKRLEEVRISFSSQSNYCRAHEDKNFLY